MGVLLYASVSTDVPDEGVSLFMLACVCVFVCFPYRSVRRGGWQQREGSYQDDTNTRVRQRRCGSGGGGGGGSGRKKLQAAGNSRVRAKWHRGGVTRQKGVRREREREWGSGGEIERDRGEG